MLSLVLLALLRAVASAHKKQCRAARIACSCVDAPLATKSCMPQLHEFMVSISVDALCDSWCHDASYTLLA